MKKIIITIIIIVAMTSACSNKEQTSDSCEVDYKFKSYFMNCIGLISVREAGIHVDSENLSPAHDCLRILTNYRSHIVPSSDSPLSYNYSDTVNYFCRDMEKWLQWYEANKCEITFDKANAILIEAEIQWPQSIDEMHVYDLGCTTIPIPDN